MRKVQAQQALAHKAAAAAAREAAFAAEQKKKAEATAAAEETKINALRDGDDTVSIAVLQLSVQRAAKVQALLLENDTAPRAQESSDDNRREMRDARSKALVLAAEESPSVLPLAHVWFLVQLPLRFLEALHPKGTLDVVLARKPALVLERREVQKHFVMLGNTLRAERGSVARKGG